MKIEGEILLSEPVSPPRDIEMIQCKLEDLKQRCAKLEEEKASNRLFLFWAYVARCVSCSVISEKNLPLLKVSYSVKTEKLLKSG